MTAEEMHTEVNLRTQKINSNVNDDFLPQEIDVYLNRAVDEFISKRWNPESNELQDGFEQNQKRIDDLRELVKKNEALSTDQVTSNAAIEDFFVDRADFPSDYRHLISVRFVVQYARNGISFSLSSGSRVADGTLDSEYKETISFGKFFQADDIYQALLDPYNNTHPKKPIYDINELGIDVYTDDTFIVPTILINYLRQPATILVDPADSDNNVDCDLAEAVHGEIVDMAVTMMLADIEKFGPQGLLRDLEDVE